jgi:hypothetical protein
MLEPVLRLIDKPFHTEKELLADLGQVLPSEELGRYRAAAMKGVALPGNALNDGGGLDTLSQLLLGRDREAKGGKLVDDLAAIQDLMLRWQQPDGSWEAVGQQLFLNRPAAEATANQEGRTMAKETIGLEEAVRLTLVQRRDIPAPELVSLLEQRYGLELDARFLPIIKASLRHKAQAEAPEGGGQRCRSKASTKRSGFGRVFLPEANTMISYAMDTGSQASGGDSYSLKRRSVAAKAAPRAGGS